MPKKKENIQTAIVCTCRVENYGWIRDRRLYNLPLPKDGKGESYAPITHIAVYALDLPVLAYTAKYVREVDDVWLAANGYKASPKPHGDKNNPWTTRKGTATLCFPRTSLPCADKAEFYGHFRFLRIKKGLGR